MKTGRFYIFMILIALLLGSVAYAVTPNQVQAGYDCYELDVCRIVYICGDDCATPGESELFKNYYYDHTNPCEWGCSKFVGCTQLCPPVVPWE